MRLFHTSDWHLGSRLFGRSLLEDQAYILDQMLNIVRDLKPDAMLICGDIFDKPCPDENALSLFHSTIASLLELGVTVIALSGSGDDFRGLHLGARWVRRQGLYLIDQPNQVLSPIRLKAAADSFAVEFWCLPFASSRQQNRANGHPAQIARQLVETAASRVDQELVNVFAGYVWVQGIGRREELARYTSAGGQPIEKRLLEYFDYCALGGCHYPLTLGAPTLRYSGGLLSSSPDIDLPKPSVCLVLVDGKGKVRIEDFPLHSRRSLRLLSGSFEELIEQSREQKREDLLMLRFQGEELTLEQKLQLKAMGPNVVSVEVEAETDGKMAAYNYESSSPLVQTALQFFKDVSPSLLIDDEVLEILRDVEKEL